MGRRRSFEIISKADIVTIGELVRLTDTRYSTLKFYTEEGMLPFEQSGDHLTRRYNRAQSMKRIQRIRQLKEDGKTISQIKEFLQK